MSTLYHPRVSIDVILAVLPYLDQSTALAVSAANRDLRAHAPLIVLQKRVVLRSYRAIVSFNAFLRAGGSFTPYCEWVHELDINLPSAFPHPCQISRLSDTLAALTGLRALTIRNPEVIFNRVPSFRRVFEGLRTLEDITIIGGGPESIKFLQNSKSYFLSVRIPEPLWRFPMAAALNSSSATACEELVAYNCHVPSIYDNAVVIPTLRRLHVPNFCIEADHRAGFMSIAPNLQLLDVGTEYSKLPWSNELAAHRHNNKAATMQFRLQVSSSHSPDAWTELGLVRGGLIDLLVFANTCPVGALELAGEPIAGSTLQRLIPELVLDYQPRVLRFSLAGPGLDMGAFVPERDRLDPVEGVYVRVVLTHVPTAAEWADCEYALAELAHSLAGCRVLCVGFDADDTAVCDFLQGKDRGELASTIIARSERVLVVCVSTSLGPAYWRADGDPGGVRQLEQPQLSNAEGRRLLTDWGVFSEAYPLCDPSSQ